MAKLGRPSGPKKIVQCAYCSIDIELMPSQNRKYCGLPCRDAGRKAATKIIVDSGFKTCTKCGVSKPIDSFYVDRFHNSYNSRCAECIAEYHKTYYEANGDKVRAKQIIRSRQSYDADPEFKRYLNKQWHKRNSSKALEYRATRRARLKAQFVEHIELSVVVERDNSICGICKQHINRVDYSLDHIIPLAKGGMHEYSNVQLAHLICNLSKGAKIVVTEEVM